MLKGKEVGAGGVKQRSVASEQSDSNRGGAAPSRTMVPGLTLPHSGIPTLRVGVHTLSERPNLARIAACTMATLPTAKNAGMERNLGTATPPRERHQPTEARIAAPPNTPKARRAH